MPESKGLFYDRLELRTLSSRDTSMLTALPGLLQQAIENAPAIADHLKDIEPETITSFEALSTLPVLRKSELMERQKQHPPLGGLNGTPLNRLAKLFMSPGPIFEPEGTRPDYWRFARALFAAGIRSGDVVHNAFSYHLTPAGSVVESGARALGCPVIPAGTGQTDLQTQVIERLRPTAYTGTPSFLKVLLERGRQESMDLSSLKKALVSGEAFPPALAIELEVEHGIGAFQCYATADLGLIAYETMSRDGMVIDEEVIVEIVRPGTGDPVPFGEVGEVVVTVFNPDYPLIRFATGDLSAMMPAPSPCGRTNRRLKGWLGRADQATKVKGIFVHPSQIATITGRHDEIGKARLVVERPGSSDEMSLHCEVKQGNDDLARAIEKSLRSVTGLRGHVTLIEPGKLADDGKVIDDRRDLG